jgi:hypothetical protein
MTPRLLTDRAAAEYLSIPLTGVRKIMAGRVLLDGRVRWDRLKLDAWIDGLGGGASQSHANENPTGADAALAQFLADQKNASRRP